MGPELGKEGSSGLGPARVGREREAAGTREAGARAREEGRGRPARVVREREATGAGGGGGYGAGRGRRRWRRGRCSVVGSGRAGPARPFH